MSEFAGFSDGDPGHMPSRTEQDIRLEMTGVLRHGAEAAGQPMEWDAAVQCVETMRELGKCTTVPAPAELSRGAALSGATEQHTARPGSYLEITNNPPVFWSTLDAIDAFLRYGDDRMFIGAANAAANFLGLMPRVSEEAREMYACGLGVAPAKPDELLAALVDKHRPGRADLYAELLVTDSRSS